MIILSLPFLNEVPVTESLIFVTQTDKHGAELALVVWPFDPVLVLWAFWVLIACVFNLQVCCCVLL